MKIAFLCKRRYMDKDVIHDRYGRLYEIPYQLSRLGHEVEVFCLDYHKKDSVERIEQIVNAGRLVWNSYSLRFGFLPKLFHYPLHLLRALRDFSPDIVVGASDIPHVVLGHWLAKRLGRPYVADLYDNFESFGHARIPGMVPALRRAVRKADLVVTTSEPLARFVRQTYRAQGKVFALPSGVDLSIFYPRDRQKCRKQLGLPLDVRLVGTAGGLSRMKGVNILYEAWQQLADQYSDIHLVLAGSSDPDLPIPFGNRVHYLGILPHAKVAELFCALDVGVMCIPDTLFGRYCFPQKAYEMLACELPVVASDVGAIGDLLASTPACLFRPTDPTHLALQIVSQLKLPTLPKVPIKDWETLIAKLDVRLRHLVH